MSRWTAWVWFCLLPTWRCSMSLWRGVLLWRMSPQVRKNTQRACLFHKIFLSTLTIWTMPPQVRKNSPKNNPHPKCMFIVHPRFAMWRMPPQVRSSYVSSTLSGCGSIFSEGSTTENLRYSCTDPNCRDSPLELSNSPLELSNSPLPLRHSRLHPIYISRGQTRITYFSVEKTLKYGQ